MEQWHITDTRAIEACEMTLFGCGYEKHYDTRAEAEDALSGGVIQQYGYKSSVYDPSNTSYRLSAEEFEQLDALNTAHAKSFQQAEQEFEAAHQAFQNTNNGRPSFRGFPVTDAMFDAHQRLKKAMYVYAVTDTLHNEHAVAHGVERDFYPFTSYTHYEQEIQNFEQWKEEQNEATGGVYVADPNPSMNGDTGERHYSRAMNALGAFTGKKPWVLKKDVETLQQRLGMDRHTAVQELYLTAQQRTDKPFVYIDLETAARKPEDVGTVDTGKYSDIIEVGYIKVYPDGSEEEGDFLLDVDPHLKAVAGTGAEHVHNISEEMVKGKPLFSDPEVQQHMMKVLSECVLVAHSANFENTQFSYNLRGYAAERSRFHIETLDTKDMTTYFVHTIEGNRNQDLVEAVGMEYSDDAHRAFADAKMTKEALEKVLADRERYLRGNESSENDQYLI